jgi:hypothetical protein
MGPVGCMAGMGGMAAWMLLWALAGLVVVGSLIAVIAWLAIRSMGEDRSSRYKSPEDVLR